MKTTLVLAVCVALPVARLQSQATQSASASTSAVAGARDLWQIASGYVLAAAEQMPDSLFAFKPTSDVRSFGQVVGHVANAQQLICGMALGQKPVESSPASKADIVAALKASNALCTRAYAMSDADGMKPLTPEAQKQWSALGFGTPRTRLYALMMNAWHDNEHYGNVVTYMRLKGMVPPSSQPKK